MRNKIHSHRSTWLILVVLLTFVAAPLVAVLTTSVLGYRGESSELGSLFDPEMVIIAGHTVWLSLLVVLFATIFALPLAVLRSWTQLSKADWIELLIMIPFMTPPFAAAMAWMDFTRLGGLASMIAGKTVGKLSHSFIFSVWGMAFIMAVEIFPFLYLILRNCLASIPASSVEAAQVSGASSWTIARRVIGPAIIGPYSLGALIVFIKAAGEFGTPVTLGNAIGYQVLVSSIYEDVTIAPLNFSSTAASSSVLFTLGVVAWGVQQWISRNTSNSGGRINRPVSVKLSFVSSVGAWMFVSLVTLVSVVIPYASITLGAMTILRSQPPTPNNLTFDYFARVLQHPVAREAIQTSAMLGAIAATTTVVLATVIVLSTRGRKGPLERGTDFLAVAPDTVPGIVLAIGLILLWNHPSLPWTPYGSVSILIIAYTAIFLPSAVQNIKTSADAISPSLEQAAEVSGASKWKILTKITLPLLAPGIFAGWILSFLIGIRELVMSSLVRPSNMNLLSPWIMNAFEQGDRAEAMAMILLGVGSSTIVLVLVTCWQSRRINKQKNPPKSTRASVLNNSETVQAQDSRFPAHAEV